MSQSRRLFLRSAALATLGLVTGADALEALERLQYRRKYWRGADLRLPAHPNHFVTARSGHWHDPATWASGKVPPPGSEVFVNHVIAADEDIFRNLKRICWAHPVHVQEA